MLINYIKENLDNKKHRRKIYNDNKINEILELDSEEQFIIYLANIGKKI